MSSICKNCEFNKQTYCSSPQTGHVSKEELEEKKQSCSHFKKKKNKPKVDFQVHKQMVCLFYNDDAN